ncbi:MAG: transporter substrate-binding domain-containing protein, partial [Oscillospiraceae bacterium]|nr:transporter substrate-binding domain-containing protein [Oscillospiraceae bacterium]
MKKIICAALIVVILAGMPFLMSSCKKNSSSNKLICGITDYEPMNFRDSAGNWTGFDTDFALLVGEKLKMEVVFQEIEWDYKYSELEAGSINCVWNGFTANTSDSDGVKRSEKVDFSYSYMLNQQCVVVKAERAGEFISEDALIGKTVAAEKGSAGEAYAVEAVGSGGKVIDSSAQVNTFLEVKSGAVDFAVVDILLAQK